MQRTLRFGLVTPVVTINPRRFSAWQEAAGIEAIHAIASTADRLGFNHMTCSEHIGIPEEIGKQRGERYYDPLATFGYIAAITKRIRFLTHVLVLPYHHPLEVAKRYGTLDRISGGRLILGLGVGSLKPEFELIGAEFARRGEVYTESLAALRSAMGKRDPVFEGRFYRYRDFVIDPHSLQQPVPMWLGGRTRISLRRALASADGWDPFGLDLAQIKTVLAEARSWPEWTARSEPFELVLAADRDHEITDSAGANALVAEISAYREAGATTLNLYFPSRSLEHYLEQLELFTTKIAPRFA
jgi:probable F420-dependent oxidoreductase